MERKRFFRPRLAFSGGTGRASPGQQAGPAVGSEARTQRFRELILPHLDAAYNLARYLARDATAAEDIVQTAFLRAHRGFDTFRGEAAKPWLFAIVRRSFLDWNASHAAEPCQIDDDEETPASRHEEGIDHDTPESRLEREQDITMVRNAVEALPEPFREALALREFEELSYKEIAAITDVPIGTVMSRIARARQMLCELILPEKDLGRRAQS